MTTNEINKKAWEEANKGLTCAERDILRSVAIGSLMVTSTPENFAIACRIARDFAQPDKALDMCAVAESL